VNEIIKKRNHLKDYIMLLNDKIRNAIVNDKRLRQARDKYKLRLKNISEVLDKIIIK